LIKTFISHSSTDHPFVEWLKTKLERENLGLDIFVDDGSVIVGDDPQKMIDEVKRSIIFIPVLSNESVKKEFVQNELKTANENETTYIFPIKLKCDKENIPKVIKTEFIAFDKVEGRIYEDFSNEKEWDIHYENLRRAIFNKIVELGLLKEDTKDFYQDCEHLDLIIQREDPTILEIKMVIDVYLKKEPYQRYFFSKLANVKWLKYLKLYGYLKTNPQPIEAQDSPGYLTIPQWYALEYLEKVSNQISDNEEAITDLLEIIKSVTHRKDAKSQHIDNYRTWYYFVKILLNIPSEKIPLGIIQLIPIWLDSKFDTMLQGSEIATKLLPKFLTDNPEDIRKAEKIIESITAVKTYPLSDEKAKILGKKEEERLVIDPYWLKEAFDKYSEVIGEKCSERVIEDSANKIRGLLKREEDGTYKSFYEEVEHPINDPLEMLTFILRRILLAKAKTDVNIAKGILRDFLKDKYLFFPKMAIYAIGQTIDHYSQLFWEIMESETGVLIMGNALYFGDELKYLLKNLKQLSEKQRNILENKIEQGIKRHTPKEDTERYLALFKQEIYEALSHDPYFKDLYEEMKKITNVDTELHPAIRKGETRWGPGPPPLAKEEILRMTNGELAEFLSKFKTKDFWEGPTVGGLSDILKEAVKANPNKFVDNLDPFENAGFIYIYKILDGLKEAWKEKKVISWGRVFDFIALYIQREQFWENGYVVEKGDWLGGADHNWVIGIIAELLQEGTRDDSWAFSEEYFDKAIEVIFLLLKEPEEDKEITDYVTYTLNTPCGKLITALIYLALRIARFNDKKGIKTEPKWSEEYRRKFEELLDKKIIEAYTSLGRFLPNLSYLDKKWVEDKIEKISSQKGSRYWEAFMDGYLSIGIVYDDLYDLMKPHYEYGLTYDFKQKHDREHLIQHICIGYLRDQEKLDDPHSLFRNIIDKWEPEQMREVIGFFWMQRDSLAESSEENEKMKEKMKEKIIKFWKQLYGNYKGKGDSSLTKEDKKILSSISRLAVFLPKIDTESYEWLMLSAPYVHEDFNSTFLIEYLDKLKDKGDSKKTAKYIGEIYLKMLEKVTPDYDKKHIRSIVEFLYNANAKENANKICNIYGSRGQEFLRDIYERYNASK